MQPPQPMPEPPPATQLERPPPPPPPPSLRGGTLSHPGQGDGSSAGHKEQNPTPSLAAVAPPPAPAVASAPPASAVAAASCRYGRAIPSARTTVCSRDCHHPPATPLRLRLWYRLRLAATTAVGPSPQPPLAPAPAVTAAAAVAPAAEAAAAAVRTGCGQAPRHAPGHTGHVFRVRPLRSRTRRRRPACSEASPPPPPPPCAPPPPPPVSNSAKRAAPPAWLRNDQAPEKSIHSCGRSLAGRATPPGRDDSKPSATPVAPPPAGAEFTSAPQRRPTIIAAPRPTG